MEHLEAAKAGDHLRRAVKQPTKKAAATGSLAKMLNKSSVAEAVMRMEAVHVAAAAMIV